MEVAWYDPPVVIQFVIQAIRFLFGSAWPPAAGHVQRYVCVYTVLYRRGSSTPEILVHHIPRHMHMVCSGQPAQRCEPALSCDVTARLRPERTRPDRN
jgi:hypothetical protein